MELAAATYRCLLQGDPQHMQKGVHFSVVFAPKPGLETDSYKRTQWEKTRVDLHSTSLLPPSATRLVSTYTDSVLLPGFTRYESLMCARNETKTSAAARQTTATARAAKLVLTVHPLSV